MIVSSPFVRAKETAEIIARKLGIEYVDIVYDGRIGELKAGTFDGKSVSEYTDYFLLMRSDLRKTLRRGENYADIKKRTADFIYDIENHYSGKNILIVTHDSPAWLLFAGAFGMNAKEALDMRGDGEFSLKTLK